MVSGNADVDRPSGPTERRTRVVDAFIDLVLAGGDAPTPSDIADRAGVSRATFFRYFATLVELRGEAALRTAERFPELLDIPAAGSNTREERIERFVDTRFKLHETLHPLQLLLRVSAAHDPESAAFIDAARRGFADQTRQYFEVDLRPHRPARREDMVAAITSVTSVESWQQFRQSHGRSPVQTRRAWRLALAGILAAP